MRVSCRHCFCDWPYLWSFDPGWLILKHLYVKFGDSSNCWDDQPWRSECLKFSNTPPPGKDRIRTFKVSVIYDNPYIEKNQLDQIRCLPTVHQHTPGSAPGPTLSNEYHGKPLPFLLAAWRSGRRWSYQRSYSTSNPVSTGMGDVSGFDSRRRHFISVCNQPTRSTQPFIMSSNL